MQTIRNGIVFAHPFTGLAGCRTPRKDWAAQQVAQNWRIRQRLPLITAYARYYAIISPIDYRDQTPTKP